MVEEQAAHGAEHARTEIDKQAALAQAEMLRASQMVKIAEQAAEAATQHTAQIKAHAEARFAEAKQEAGSNVRTGNAIVDGAHSSLQAAEDRHKHELANLTAQSRATLEQQRQLMTSMNQD